jgi:RNA recognition motif-containing protein
MAILNIPYTYPKSWLQRDIDQMGLPYTGLHYPNDRKSKNRSRGFAFVKFATSEAAHVFQQKFHHRELSSPGSPTKSVSVVPSESSTTSSQMLLGSRADYRGAGLETERWPPQRLAAPPGLHQEWHASRNQNGGFVDPLASPFPVSIFEDGAVVLHRFSV